MKCLVQGLPGCTYLSQAFFRQQLHVPLVLEGVIHDTKAGQGSPFHHGFLKCCKPPLWLAAAGSVLNLGFEGRKGASSSAGKLYLYFEQFSFQGARALFQGCPGFSGSIALAQKRAPHSDPVTVKEESTYLWNQTQHGPQRPLRRPHCNWQVNLCT